MNDQSGTGWGSTRGGLQITSWLALVALCTGCAASVKQSVLGQPMRERMNILVRTSDEVNKTDDAGGVGQLVDTIYAGLREHGIDSQIYAAPDEHPHAPRIELHVQYWSERTAASHKFQAASMAVPILGAGMLFGSNNQIVVLCKVFLKEGEQPAFTHRYSSASFGDQPTGVAETVGNSILDDVVR